MQEPRGSKSHQVRAPIDLLPSSRPTCLGLLTNLQLPTGRHHGKWAYTDPQSGFRHAFIGDLNRCKDSQWPRGGGGVIIASKALHKFLESHTVATQTQTQTRAQPAVASFALSSASSGVGAASLEAAASSTLSEQ